MLIFLEGGLGLLRLCLNGRGKRLLMRIHENITNIKIVRDLSMM